MRYTENDVKLSKFFANKASNNELIPYMTEISKETDISVATISRFAKRKGFYNFPEMRAKLNKKTNDKIFISPIFVEFIQNNQNQRFVVITSVSCQSIGYHLTKRLNDLNIITRFVDHQLLQKGETFNTVQDNEKIIFITITGESTWWESLIKIHLNNKTILMSVVKPDVVPPNCQNEILPNHNITDKSVYGKYTAVRKMFNWLDDCINVISVEKNRKK